MGPSKPRAHFEGFRAVQDGTSGGPPKETPKTISNTIQEHSFITSLFRLVVFGSLSSPSCSCRRRRYVFFSVQRLDKIFCCVQKSDQKIPVRPPDVHLDPGPVLGRRGRRASTVDARPLATARRRIQKPARHRSRSENESFAPTDATHNHQRSFFFEILIRPLDTKGVKRSSCTL